MHPRRIRNDGCREVKELHEMAQVRYSNDAKRT